MGLCCSGHSIGIKEHRRHERRHPYSSAPLGRYLALGDRRRVHRNDDRLHQFPGADVQAGQAAGLTSGQISSWIWVISIGMAVCSIGLSLRYRTPITIAWSTPGAALLITSLGGVTYGEAIGAYITCACW